MVQEAKSPVKNLVRNRSAEGFNSGVKGLSYLYCCILLLWKTEKLSNTTYVLQCWLQLITCPACFHSLVIFCLIIRCVSHIYDIGFLWSYWNLQVLLLIIVTLYWFKVIIILCLNILLYLTLSFILILQSFWIWSHVLTMFMPCIIFHIIFIYQQIMPTILS
jgi:hypothetical protein